MEKVNLFLSNIENELLDSFFKVYKDSLVAISNRQGGWGVELTRDVALQLLNTVMMCAMKNGLAVKIDTNSDLVNGRFLTKCTLVIIDDGREVMNLSAFGEGLDTGTNLKTGEQYVNENALRASETRAIKRVIEYITPAIGRTLKYISVQLQKFINANAGVTITYIMLNNAINNITDALYKSYLEKKGKSEKPEQMNISNHDDTQNAVVEPPQAQPAVQKQEFNGVMKNVKKYSSKQITSPSITTQEEEGGSLAAMGIREDDLQIILDV